MTGQGKGTTLHYAKAAAIMVKGLIQCDALSSHEIQTPTPQVQFHNKTGRSPPMQRSQRNACKVGFSHSLERRRIPDQRR